MAGLLLSPLVMVSGPHV